MCWGITKSFLKKSGGIRPWIAPLSINHSPVTIHTLHPPPLTLPCPRCHSPSEVQFLRLPLLQHPTGKRQIRERSPQCHKPEREHVQDSPAPHRDVSASSLLAAATWTALPTAGHRTQPLSSSGLGCTAKPARFNLILGHAKAAQKQRDLQALCVTGAAMGLETELASSSFSDLFTRAALSRWLCPDPCLQLCWACLATHSATVWRLDDQRLTKR